MLLSTSPKAFSGFAEDEKKIIAKKQKSLDYGAGTYICRAGGTVEKLLLDNFPIFIILSSRSGQFLRYVL